MAKKEILRPYGDIGAINDLARLFSDEKKEGRMFGYSFQMPSDGSLTIGDIAREIKTVYEGHRAGNTENVTKEVMAGAY